MIVGQVAIVDQMLNEEARVGLGFYVQAYFPNISSDEVRLIVDIGSGIVFDVLSIVFDSDNAYPARTGISVLQLTEFAQAVRDEIERGLSELR